LLLLLGSARLDFYVIILIEKGKQQSVGVTVKFLACAGRVHACVDVISPGAKPTTRHALVSLPIFFFYFPFKIGHLLEIFIAFI
jgi:hypothetical protein